MMPIDEDLSGEGADSLAEALRYNEALMDLDLRGNNVGDGGAEAFARAIGIGGLDGLAKLDLGYNEIRDDGAFALAQAMKANAANEGELVRLSLGNNYLTQFGKAALDEAESLVREVTGKDVRIPY